MSDVRRRITLAVTMLGLAVGILAFTPQAGAQETLDTQSDSAVFDIVQVSGFVDAIVADFIEQSITEAEEAGSGGVILQVNSSATVIDDARVIELARRIHEATVPVYSWVGPSGARAEGGIAQLMAVTDEMGIASFAKYGNTGQLVVGENGDYLAGRRLDGLLRRIPGGCTGRSAEHEGCKHDR